MLLLPRKLVTRRLRKLEFDLRCQLNTHVSVEETQRVPGSSSAGEEADMPAMH